MIEFDERWYYISRARTSRELAEAARDDRAANAHRELHRLYLERADETPLQLRERL